MRRVAIYAGSFDIFTNGHRHIVDRSLELFDEIILLVAVAPTKKTMFSQKERVKMLETLFQNHDGIKVDSWDGLIVEYARSNKIKFIVRGLRPTGDFEIEFQMAAMNSKLYEDVETVFFMTGGEHYFVSSSLVRDIWGHKGDISKFVPQSILKDMKKMTNDNK